MTDCMTQTRKPITPARHISLWCLIQLSVNIYRYFVKKNSKFSFKIPIKKAREGDKIAIAQQRRNLSLFSSYFTFHLNSLAT